ncbi:MAG: CPBP family intramembrane glutamic endopeptidase [Oscillospiraceae bacterium]
MKKFYEKSEIWFAAAWIIIYVVAMGNLRNNFGDESLYSMLGVLIIAVILTVFIVKNKLTEKYGLVRCSEGKKYLYYIPFILLCTVNLWFGVALHYDLQHQIIAVVTMALVGYVEEIIFRGLLYKAIEKDSVKQAIIISAVTFGAGHIVNLLTGHGSVDTVLQMAYAIAVGFAFVMCFYKSGSLLPCIVTHSVIDITSKFSNHNISEQTEQFWNYGATAFIILVAGGYALYLRKINKAAADR